MTKKSKEDAATSARRKAGARELGVLEGKLARKKKGERKTPQGQWATSESLRKTGGKLSKNEYNTMASNYNRVMLKGKDDKDAVRKLQLELIKEGNLMTKLVEVWKIEKENGQ